MRRRKQDYWMSSSNILKEHQNKNDVKHRIGNKKTATCISVAVYVLHAKN